MKKLSTLLSAVLLLCCTSAFAQFENYKILDLTSPSNPESFEYNDKNVWKETYNEVDYTFFESQIYMFSHLIDGNSYGGTSWSGFTVSKNASTEDMSSATGGWTKNQWGCMAGGGIANINPLTMQPIVSADSPYLVCYYSAYTMDDEGPVPSNQIMFNDGKDYKLMGTFIAMHPWAYYGCLNGDAYSRKLDQEGDYFSVIAHGSLNGGAEKTVEYKLAEVKDGVLNMPTTWQWMDLTSLGTVDYVYFTVDGSDKGQWGLNTAAYFCMDRLVAELDPTSAVEEKAEVSKVQKVMENGVIYIIKGDKKYNLLGAEVK